jgi:hypothetical protein
MSTVVALQSIAKDLFYSTVYYRTLNLSCEAQRVSKNGENGEDSVRSQR